MTTPLICLAIALLLPYLLAGGSVYYRRKQLGTVNINDPRTQATQLTGAGARIVNAQHNAWEALIIFTVSLFIATQAGVKPETMTIASVVFIAARVCHAFFFIAGVATGRVLSFSTALGACLWLIINAL